MPARSQVSDALSPFTRHVAYCIPYCTSVVQITGGGELTIQKEQLALRHTWILMLLDLLLLFAMSLTSIVDASFTLSLNPLSENMARFSSYLTLTMRFLRLLLWTLMIISLSQLPSGFQKARVWYLLRMLTFFIEFSEPAMRAHFMNLINLSVALDEMPVYFFAALFITAVIMPLISPVAVHLILKAGGDMLAYYGLTGPARSNRRCAWVLVISAVIFACLMLIFIVFFFYIVYAEGQNILEYLTSPETSVFLKYLVDGAILLSVLCVLLVNIAWIIAVRRMHLTCRCIKEIYE